MPEFKRSAFEVLRQGLEDGDVTISRSAGRVTLPCAFMLVTAMNPCPYGYLGDPKHECRCSPTQIQRYRSKISGPLLDRIDLHIEAPALSFTDLRSEKPGEASAPMRERVQAASARQHARFASTKITSNARMTHAQIRKHCTIDSAMGDLLQQAMEQLSLSARAYDRILKVACTIADLAGAARIESPHLLEAIQYRSLDRPEFYLTNATVGPISPALRSPVSSPRASVCPESRPGVLLHHSPRKSASSFSTRDRAVDRGGRRDSPID